jgi:hypothetical protein
MYEKTIKLSQGVGWLRGFLLEGINGESREMLCKTQTGFGSGYSAMSIPNRAAVKQR